MSFALIQLHRHTLVRANSTNIFHKDDMCDIGINPIALRMAKTPLSFDHSECNRVKNKCTWLSHMQYRLHTTFAEQNGNQFKVHGYI